MSKDITQTGPLDWKELQEANQFPTEAQMKEHLERASRNPNYSYNPQGLLEDMAATPWLRFCQKILAHLLKVLLVL